MSKLSVSIAGLWLGAAGAVWAQAAAPASAAASAAKPAVTEAQAAMERAQRLAANPMKVILQASKIRRRSNEPEPEAADPNILRRTAARSEASAPAPALRPVTTAAAPGVSVPPPSAPPPAPAPEPVVVNKFLPTALTGASAEVPDLQAAAPAVAAPTISKAVAPTALPIAPQAVQPTLVTMVDPEIPVRLMADGNRIKEVFADLQLRPDGTVSEVKLLPPVPRGWQSYIVSALERWRFEPLPASRVHRVQLVFEER